MRSFPQTSPETLIGRELNSIEAKHAPPRLYYAGDQNLLVGQRVASIVGSRRPSSEGLLFAASLARWLVTHEAVVLSGLASGIDTAAHTGALGAGGRTTAVLGTPLDRVSPAHNKQLQFEIMERHLALSQFDPGMPVGRHNFPIRNRTMALLSAFTVIAEATDKSGSLHQGWEALRLGRPLFIAARMFESPTPEWVLSFERYGAIPLAEETFQYLIEYLPEPGSFDYAAGAAA